MAHQQNNLPWDLLARNLTPVFEQKHQVKPTVYLQPPKPHLQFCESSQQEDDLAAFKTAFRETIEAAARSERARYPATLDKPADDDTIVSDELARRITPLVHRWREDVNERVHEEAGLLLSDEEREWWKHLPENDDVVWNGTSRQIEDYRPKQGGDGNRPSDGFKGGYGWDTLCDHKDDGLDFRCGCILPYQERQARAFLRKRVEDSYSEFPMLNAKAYFNVEVTKALILSGGMEPMLRMATRQDNNFKEWIEWQQGDCMSNDLTWIFLADMALYSYIVLNTFYCFPDLWPSNAEEKPDLKMMEGKTFIELDYRRTDAYQDMMVACCNRTVFDDIHCDMYDYKHVVVKGTKPFDANASPYDAFRTDCYTTLQMSTSFTEYLETGRDKKPDPFNQGRRYGFFADDVVEAVQDVCQNFCLPEELCLSILDFLPKKRKNEHRLPVKHDPLHPDNHDELIKYMDECWAIMARCEMLTQATGFDLCWEDKLPLWQLGV